RRIAIGGPLVDQEKIDRDHFRLQPRDRLDDPGYFGARQRIGAAELDDGVVDRNDRHEVRRRLNAARQRSHVSQCRLEPVEKPQMAAGMAEPYRACPQSRAEQRNQNMKTSTVHLRVFYCPNLAIRAVTRAGGQRLTIRLPDGSTSTPSPGASTTLPRPTGLATRTRHSTTNTDVFAPSASTAHLVPRTAAIACGVTTSNRGRPGCFGTSSSRALLLSSTESTWPSRLRSLSSNFAPLSATIVIAVGQWSVCVPWAACCALQPNFAGWATASPVSSSRLEKAIHPARASIVMAASPS